MTVSASTGAQVVTRKAREAGDLRDSRPATAVSGTNLRGMLSLFKPDGEIRIMALANRQIQSIPFGGARAERSMPMFTSDGEHVVYAEGARKDMDLFLIDGASWSLSSLGINTPQEELGACYDRAPVKR